uniref:RenE n=1 Tax=Candidatus Endohaliclona renieramycinifaciens TaxID=2565582 RepID=A0A4D6G617_9GAMM|nr:RenE [Candidatus Endohaliclona renieramycinifaciens]
MDNQNPELMDSRENDSLIGNYVFPASSSQEMLWFLYNLDNKWRSIYNIPAAIKAEGKIDRIFLQRAVNYIVSRHESLRTRLFQTNGKLFQVIKPEVEVTLSYISLDDIDEKKKWAEALRLMAFDAQNPFPLSEDSLLRITLFKLSNDVYCILIVINHIIADGLSVEIIVSELIRTYQAFSNNTHPDLTNLPVQFVDFVAWQQEWMKTKDYERHHEYWIKQLNNVPLVLELPTDRSRALSSTGNGATKQFIIQDDLSKRLRLFARNSGTTLYTVLLTAFASLLFRYTKQEEFLIGIPIANRQRAELEPIVGFLANTLVIRCDFKGDPEVKEVLNRIHKAVLEAVAFQKFPFPNIVEELRPERLVNRNPIFQIMFGLQEIQPLDFNKNSEKYSQLFIDYGLSKFDLSLFLMDDKNSIKGYLEYNSYLFDIDRIERFIQHYEIVLEGFIEERNKKVSELKLLRIIRVPESEQMGSDDLVLSENTLGENTLIELLELQARQSPNQTSVRYNNVEFSYKELNATVNQLANFLIRRGIKPGNRVSIILNQSFELLISILAVLKIGAVYIFLEPRSCLERIDYILKGVGSSALITKGKLFPINLTIPLVVKIEDLNLDHYNSENPEIKIFVDDIAFMTYEANFAPKLVGINVTHRNIINTTSSISREFNLTYQDVFLSINSQSLDLAPLEFFLPIYMGAMIVIVDENQQASDPCPWKLKDITVVQGTQSVLYKLIESNSHPKSKFTALCYRENFRSEIYNYFYKNDIKFCNLHGSLGTVTFLSKKSSQNANVDTTVVTSNSIHVTDQNLSRVPIGVCGELWVDNVSISSGYSSAALTSSQFLPNPFTKELGARMFRTGNTVRIRRHNILELIKNTDSSIQFRGFSTNLDGIMSLLKMHDFVQDVAVFVPESETEDTIIACIVTNRLDKEELKDDLQNLIKKYTPFLLPITFFFVDFIPLKEEKVNYEALSELCNSASNTNTRTEQMMPRTPTENTLTEIWKNILKRTNVGIHDDFFQMGGNSLLVGQLASEIEKFFKLKISMKNIFENTTIESLALTIESGLKKANNNTIEHSMEKILDKLTNEQIDSLLNTPK